jgi:hypothetical protein
MPTTAPKKPQDHQPKAAPPADLDAQIVEFDYDGLHLVADGDAVTGEIMEQLSAGHLHTFLKALLGPEGWDKIKALPVRKYKDILDAWAEAKAEAGNS